MVVVLTEYGEEMNIDKIFNYDGSNSSGNNSAEILFFEITSLVDVFTILLSFPINSYVIWLIFRRTGNGLAAEFFSLNLAICEILICVGCVFSLLVYKSNVLWISDFFDGLAITTRPLFQCLISVERYLAVLHPVIFLKLKPLRYRVICSALTWVAGFISCGVNVMTLMMQLTNLNYAFFFAQFFLIMCVQMFCFMAVLRALNQSGPGERRRDRDDENHMKRRAFYLLLITNVTMVVLYVPYITFLVPEWISGHDPNELSSVSYVSFTFTSLVQPLLYFYRVGKLQFIKCL